jgi:hypothetical protein
MASCYGRATADVLKVISRSTFKAVLKHVGRIGRPTL